MLKASETDAFELDATLVSPVLRPPSWTLVGLAEVVDDDDGVMKSSTSPLPPGDQAAVEGDASVNERNFTKITCEDLDIDKTPFDRALQGECGMSLYPLDPDVCFGRSTNKVLFIVGHGVGGVIVDAYKE